MAKNLQKIELSVLGTKDEAGAWQVKLEADLVIALDEYPEWTIRKGIAIVLTPAQEASIKSFVQTVVLPQAELAK